MLVKNPWGRFTWNGRYSIKDNKNWNQELKDHLHYDDLKAKSQGIFWIDFDSVVEWFDSMDINWNPELLIYRKSVYDMWKAYDMMNDSFNLSHNPQFCLKFQEDTKSHGGDDTIITRIVLSKMIVTIDGFEEEQEKATSYLALHLYHNN